MSIKLKLSMFGSVAAIIGITTLAFLFFIEFFTDLTFYYAVVFAVIFNLFQWLIAPYIIQAAYKCVEADEREYWNLHRILDKICTDSDLRKKPKLMIAEVQLPNAFAYGNFLTGSRVAVTRGLLTTLEIEEIEAVMAHEIGHIKHKDMSIMMFVSLLPAIFYWIGRVMMYSIWLSSWGTRDRRGGSAILVAIGFFSLLIYFFLNLFVLAFSRLREYYADEHAALTIHDGSRKLSEALAKINIYMTKMIARNPRAVLVPSHLAFRPLLITDPERAASEAKQLQILTGYSDYELVEMLRRRKLKLSDKIMEIFSTHPNITKRLRRLEKLKLR